MTIAGRAPLKPPVYGVPSERLFRSGSTARGLAVLAWLGILALAGRLGAESLSLRPAGPRPVCAVPVEVASELGPRLGCAAELAVAPCAGLRPGDRVDLSTCAVTPGGMGGAARLLVGLRLDVNRAGAKELELLPGIGPKLAASIVADRAERGAYPTVSSLTRVRGIGAGKLRKLSPMVTVDAEAVRQKKRAPDSHPSPSRVISGP